MAIQNITGMLSQSEMSVLEIKTQKTLVHKSIGLWNSTMPENPKQVVGGGTAIFYKQKLIKFKDYTSGNRNDAGDTIKREKIEASVVGSMKAHYEIETLELPQMATREAYISHIANGITQNMASLMDAIYLDAVVSEAKKLSKRHSQLIFPNASTGTDTFDQGLKKWKDATVANREANYLIVADAKIEIARKLDEYNIGSNEADYAVILHKAIVARLLLAMPKAGDSATMVGRQLADGDTKVAGIGGIKDHVFLTKNIQADRFHKTKGFDFRNVVGAIIHRDCVFVAYQGMLASGAVDPNSGNQKYIIKFNYFQKLVRPELYGLFVNAQFVKD